jgi:hypothetical protein
LKEPYISLYKEFIQSDINEPNKSIPGLYEKLCYIRDRAIYRPSVVIDRRNGGYIQTSYYFYTYIFHFKHFTGFTSKVKYF